ncbi:MAG: hypothetical protein RBQ91_07545 [Acholeplasma sp.]|nr:hypothetical protein [Acholeplasma sp.]
MNKWQLARYLFDAKKCVDSIWFIDVCIDFIKHIDLKKKVDDLRRHFYISLRIVIDKSITGKKEKKALSDSDSIINEILYEADKNQAHKDDNYIPKEFSSISEIVEHMKIQLLHVAKICSSSLPKEFNIAFMPHDKELSRLAFNITPELEEELLRIMHPHHGETPEGNPIGDPMPVINDTEELNRKESTNNHAVIIKGGLGDFEGVQNRQDSCILINASFGTQMWVNYDNEKMKELIQKFIAKPTIYYIGYDLFNMMKIFEELENFNPRKGIQLTLDNYEFYLKVSISKFNFQKEDVIVVESAADRLLFYGASIKYSYRINHSRSGQPNDLGYTIHKDVIKLNIGGNGTTGKLSASGTSPKILSITGWVKVD